LMNLAEGDTLRSIALLDEDRRVERERALAAESQELQDAAPPAEQNELPGAGTLMADDVEMLDDSDNAAESEPSE
jgi:hypothetical protein